MCPPPTAVIFDLDGTLVQTREASWKVFEPISRRHRLGIDTAEQFYQLFGDNFFTSLRTTCGSVDRADVVTAEFMDALDEHYAPAMVPGLVDVVKAMVPHSRLAVLSSNTTAVIRRVLRANNLQYCFAHVFGGDVEPDKAAGIARFLADAAAGSGRLCQAYYDEPADPAGLGQHSVVDPRKVALITDTVGDVEAAVRSKIRAVGVAWGMHTEEQLLAAGAEFVAIWPQELLAHLYGRAADSCSCTHPASAQAGRSAAAEQRAAAARRSERRTSSTSRVGKSTAPHDQRANPDHPPAADRSGVRATTAGGRANTDPLLFAAIAKTIR